MINELIESILFVLIAFSPFIIGIIYLCWLDRCPKGKFHKWKYEEGSYVKGDNLGFGITNGYTNVTYTCEKCGEKIETFN